MFCFNTPAYGYHQIKIQKGFHGQWSKVTEELLEFQDAVSQKAVLMSLCELSDLYCALHAYCEFNGYEDVWNSAFLRESLPVSTAGWELPETQATQLTSLLLEFHQTPRAAELLNIMAWLETYCQQYNMTLRDIAHLGFLTHNAFKTGVRA